MLFTKKFIFFKFFLINFLFAAVNNFDDNCLCYSCIVFKKSKNFLLQEVIARENFISIYKDKEENRRIFDYLINYNSRELSLKKIFFFLGFYSDISLALTYYYPRTYERASSKLIKKWANFLSTRNRIIEAFQFFKVGAKRGSRYCKEQVEILNKNFNKRK